MAKVTQMEKKLREKIQIERMLSGKEPLDDYQLKKKNEKQSKLFNS
jgi:hypothetical protein